jgi:hypothetical protein
MKRIFLALLALPLVTGCDAIKQRMGIQDPAKLEAEGNAIGSACRHAGRGLEDCYKLNPKAPKASVFAGWKEMNEYMLKNNMQAMPPQLSPDTHPAADSHGKAKDGEHAADTTHAEAGTTPTGDAASTEKPDETKKEGAAH